MLARTRGFPEASARGPRDARLMRSILRTLPAALGLATVLAVPSAQAAPSPTYQVDVTGIHVVDWQYQGANYPAECKAWSKGSGTQTLGIRTTKPAQYMLLAVPGTAPQLLMSKLGAYAGSAQRSADWKDHTIPQTAACTPCGPLSEYGECDEGDPDLLAPLHDCRTKKSTASAAIALVLKGQSTRPDGPAALANSLRVDTSVVAQFPSCPPTQSGGPGLHSADALEVPIVGPKVARVLKLRRGQKLTLKGAEERGFANGKESSSCSKPAGGEGYSECAVTDVTVEIRRIR